MNRIAVASTDGVTINAHFGRAERFYIFRIDDDGTVSNDGVREVALPAGLPEEERLDAKAELLGDADCVLSARIGPAAVRALARRETRGYAHTGDIADVLNNFVTILNRKKRREMQP
jgi:predicted Fe-Mo cluster-binding NifX family protein